MSKSKSKRAAKRLKKALYERELERLQVELVGMQRWVIETGARVLVLTTFDLDEYVYDALRAGASGFLLKDMRRDDLVNAVRVVAGGEALLAPTVTRRLIADVVARAPRPPTTGRLNTLTARETETLKAVARGLSNAEIAEALTISPATAKTHVAHLLTKLDARDRIQLVIIAYRSSLALTDLPAATAVSPDHRTAEGS